MSADAVLKSVEIPSDWNVRCWEVRLESTLSRKVTIACEVINQMTSRGSGTRYIDLLTLSDTWDLSKVPAPDIDRSFIEEIQHYYFLRHEDSMETSIQYSWL